MHDHSDYYDSLRPGKRAIVGILLEQTPFYDPAMEPDVHLVRWWTSTAILRQAISAPILTVIDRTGLQ